jgi:hypothetical protein
VDDVIATWFQGEPPADDSAHADAGAPEPTTANAVSHDEPAEADENEGVSQQEDDRPAEKGEQS